MTKVLFPEPETPVTQVKSPMGNIMLIFFRLFSDAPFIVRKREPGFRRLWGTGISNRWERYLPVKESLFFKIFSGVPQKTTSPPARPAPGPMSIT